MPSFFVETLNYRPRCIDQGLLVFAAVLCLCSMATVATADCPRPAVGENIYTLNESNSFDYGEHFAVACLPGYSPEIVTTLGCEKSGSWKGKLPDCDKIEKKIRWWILLVILVSVIVLVPCIFPRIYYHCWDKPHVTRLQQNYRRKVIKDQQEDIVLMSVKKKDQDFNDRSSGDSDLNTENDQWLEKKTTPLPPIRNSHKNLSQNQTEGFNSNNFSSPHLLPLQTQASGTAKLNDQIFSV